MLHPNAPVAMRRAPAARSVQVNDVTEWRAGMTLIRLDFDIRDGRKQPSFELSGECAVQGLSDRR